MHANRHGLVINSGSHGSAQSALRLAIDAGVADMAACLDTWRRDVQRDSDARHDVVLAQVTAAAQSLVARLDRLERKLDAAIAARASSA